MKKSSEKVAVFGLGYVGLPVAVAMARAYESVTGYDISGSRVDALKRQLDKTGEISADDLLMSGLRVTNALHDVAEATFFVVTVPTPIDAQQRPDLRPLQDACMAIGSILKRNDVVVFESTVYPGVTEEFCGPILERQSQLKSGSDFYLGYSPERINPGDRTHRLENVIKIISADCAASLGRVRDVYGAIVHAGLHEATSIKVAEAAKVLENTQRDINIALMNELSIIMDRMGIRTRDVLEAAGTKWNFLKFTPGLVGGHCIGVDPYYLTSAAEAHGYHPEIILAGRRLNDEMGKVVAAKTIKLLAQQGFYIKGAKVGILGLTFKEDVTDIRNSKVPDIISELQDFGVAVVVHDPMADSEDVRNEYGLLMSDLSDFRDLDGLILAVNHAAYQKTLNYAGILKEGGVLVDVKAVLHQSDAPKNGIYWSL